MDVAKGLSSVILFCGFISLLQALSSLSVYFLSCATDTTFPGSGKSNFCDAVLKCKEKDGHVWFQVVLLQKGQSNPGKSESWWFHRKLLFFHECTFCDVLWATIVYVVNMFALTCFTLHKGVFAVQMGEDYSEVWVCLGFFYFVISFGNEQFWSKKKLWKSPNRCRMPSGFGLCSSV